MTAFLAPTLIWSASVLAGETLESAGMDSLPSGAISATQHFHVTGGRSADAACLAVWAEEVAERLEKLMGPGIFSRRGEHLQIALRRNPDTDQGRVIRAQSVADWRLRQKLILVNAEAVDHEEILESFCWLLLNRYVIAFQDWSQRRRNLGAVPEWFAVGVAQNLYPALRSRNNGIVWQTWKEGIDFPLERILACDEFHMCAGPRRAAAGVALGWLTSEVDAESGWKRLFSYLAEGDKLTMNRIARELLGLPSVRASRQEWSLWVASRDLVHTEWGTCSVRDIRQLKELLLVSPEILSLIIREERMSPITFADLTGVHDAPWMPALTKFLNLKLRGLAIGRSDEFRRVVNMYTAYLDALTPQREKSFISRWFLRGGIPGKKAEALLEKAQTALIKLEEHVSRKPRLRLGISQSVTCDF